MPPLYRISQGGTIAYARDDDHKNQMLETVFTGRGKVEISRFKGLGEMPPTQLRETTMCPKSRKLLKVVLPPGETISTGPKVNGKRILPSGPTGNLVEELMGKRPELRLKFIQQNAGNVEYIDI